MADADEVQNRLEQSMNGTTPKINPDEQRTYLGTFRERVALTITVSQITNPQALAAAEQVINDHPDYVMLINGNLSPEQQSPYLKLATTHNVKFTLKTDQIYAIAPDKNAIVIAADHAINLAEVAFKASATTTASAQPATHKSIWQRLFHK
ncbi:hypothetical protein B808_1202 [Fructilactobacillus florum 8D]|uniref:DUF1694 domain-containing protein n=2 Tax=Fructilactobacillus florum TaxID=640331 RepID=W9EF53_9LACO|nr:YueI family protein [Fructilactobacillus florum]EKK20888.1 hypothetical protein B807_298 [Fructilactobacillus florum 2F]ETO39871.1 hypothetical protein B808_1202 [Fructilactobacillus florum 8D]KRM92443.1 hypothetical protein FC87_GL000055 [Fructilactobacillus florum DSM 22689 = JCM 16035]